MNWYNHFLTCFIILFMLFANKVSIMEIIIFSCVFGVLLDINQKIGECIKKPKDHMRTWIEEPFGLIILGIPLGLLLGLIKHDYLLMTILPWGIHIIQDYLTIHKVSPFAPFSKKSVNTGIFKSVPPPLWYTGNEKGLSENYFLILNIIGAILVLVKIYMPEFL